MLRLLVMLLFVLPALTWAYPTPKNQTIKRVIYITFDGLRWQDFFEPSIFPKFWNKYAKKVNIYGAPAGKTSMEVASLPISLPSFRSQMLGFVDNCENNLCGRVTAETLPEYLVNRFQFQRKEVATFASWPKMEYVVEHIQQTTYSNIGNYPAYDPDTQVPDDIMTAINRAQAQDHPVSNTDGPTRMDKYTFAQAMHYFEKYQPKFLWISLVESDDAAHEGKQHYYYKALAAYDEMIDQVFRKLQELKLEESTLIIVTTDHGRGNGANWTTHGKDFPESKRTWAFVYNGALTPVSHEPDMQRYSTLSIRPTIEQAITPFA